MTILRKALLGLLLLVAVLVVAGPLLAIALVGLAIVSAFTLVVVLWAIVILGETWVDVGLKDYSFWDALDESLGDVLTGLALAIRAYRRRDRTPLVQRVASVLPAFKRRIVASLPLLGQRAKVVGVLSISPFLIVAAIVQEGYRSVRKDLVGTGAGIKAAWAGEYL